MSVEKRSLISTLKAAKKAKVASAEPSTKSAVTSKRMVTPKRQVGAKRQITNKRRVTSKSEIVITKTTNGSSPTLMK